MLKILQDEEGVKLTDPSIISHYEAGRVTPPTNTSIAIVRVLRRRKVLTSVEDLFGL
jgi:hypothetical protein